MESLITEVYPELTYVNVNRVKFDDAYQRILMPGHVKNISKTFDPNAFQPITVNQRENGDLIVIDGQHRVEAVKLNADPNLIFVPAQLLRLGRTEEVDLFYKINVTKQGLSVVDRFYPEVLQGHPDSVFIHNLLQDVNVFYIPSRSNSNPSGNKIKCVGAMKHVYRECVMVPHETPGKVLDKTIRMMANNWAGTSDNALAKIVKGLANFLNMYGGTDFFEIARLEKAMKKYKPRDIIDLANSYPTLENHGTYEIKKGDNLAIAQALRVKYNEVQKDNPITDSLALWLQDDNESVINNKTNYIN